jgi:pyrroline-5-carboxylate reductase
MTSSEQTTTVKQSIAFIGAGNMAGAIIQGLVESGSDSKLITASNPSQQKLEKLAVQCGIRTTNDNLQAAEQAEVIVLGIKPQKLPDVCKHLGQLDLSGKLIISVVAGVTVDTIAKYLNQPLAVVRAMPNTPATVSAAATGMYANQATTQSQRQFTEAIFAAIGITEWLENESLIDVVTGIAGSAPAYVFQFIQSMVEQAIAHGMSAECARNLATQAVLGAAKLAQAKPESTLHDLRVAVTSPGGTTAAALNSFADDGFSNIIKKAVAAAVNRGRELGEQA